MLKSRVITALLLAPLVVLAVFKLETAQFASVLAAVVVLAGWELGNIAGLRAVWQKALYVSVLACLLIVFWFVKTPWIEAVAYLLAALWWVMFFMLALGGRLNKKTAGISQPATLVGGAVLLILCWGALSAIHSIASVGPGMLMFLMLLIWTADSGAYFTGKAFGRNKLAPAISPGKTWEGVYGALASTLLCGLVVYQTEWLGHFELTWILLLCVTTALISVAGDLWESLLKRHAGMKDSGKILPGHGGILDRIDSLIAAAPFFASGLWLMGRLA